jgi:hypothetical protein
VILTTLILTLILGGCGGSGSQSTGTGSQLDQQAAGASATGNTGTNATGTATAPAVSGNEQVLAGYTADQCLADMAARYGTSSDAQRVCAQVHQDFGANAPKTQLPAALTQTESKLGVKPVAGQPPAADVSAGNGGGAPAGGTPAGGTPAGGASGGTSSGWDNGGIVITVPQGPAGP